MPPAAPNEQPHLKVRFFPPGIDAVGDKPVAMVPTLMILVIILSAFVAPAIGKGALGLRDYVVSFVSQPNPDAKFDPPDQPAG